MNDRVSNAPPPTFLGPEEMAAYERQFYAESNHTSSRPTSGSEHSFNRNSGSKFWEGIRDRFTRTKSSSSITTVSSSKSKSSNRFSQQSQQSQVAASAPNEKENVSGYYPSREEVMENYKNLVDAGFFSSHAIQGTRHQPPPSRWSGQKTDHPLPAPPPPARDAPPAPFSRLVAQKQRQLQHQSQIQNNPATPALSSIFASIPYSATQPSPTGDAPLTTYARPDPRPPISLPKKYRRPHPTTYQMVAPPPTTSPHRGTKRAMADMTGGSVDREMTNASTDNIAAEAGARKLVKKLRKSASRISADLSLRPATSAGSGNLDNHPYGSAALPSGSTKDVRGATRSSTSVNLVPRPPTSSAGRAVGSVVRSLSNSFKRDGGGTTASVVPNNEFLPPPGANIPLPTTTPNKLLKAKRSLTRRVSLGRSRSTSTSSSSMPPPVPSHAPPTVPIHRPQGHHQQPQPQPPIIPFSDPEPTPRPSTTTPHPDEGDPMVLDPTTPEPPARNTSLDVQPGGLSVPSFHYPQRRKKAVVVAGGPLAEVPDPNFGVVPEVVVPTRFGGGGRHVKSGSFCFGTPAAASACGMMMAQGGGGEGKENGEFAVF